jgi:hypothetical protein
MMSMEARHISQSCRVKHLDRGVQTRGIEVPAKASGVRVKGIGVLVRETDIDALGLGRSQVCNIGIGAGVWTY